MVRVLKIAGSRCACGDAHGVAGTAQLRELLRQTQAELIHCLDLEAAGDAQKLEKKYPVLVTLSREDLENPGLEKLLKKRCCFLVAEAETRSRLLRLGFMSRRIVLAPEGDLEPVYEKLCKQFAKKKTYDIALAGYYGFGNFGDDLILHTLIQQLRQRRPEISIVALTRDPVGTMEKFDVDCVHRFKPLPLLKTLRRSKCYACGGGTLLTDASSRRSLWYYGYMLLLAKKMGLTTMLLANGIGPLAHPKSQKLVGKALKRTDFISLRDRESMALASKLGVGERTIFTSDLAVLFAPRKQAELRRQQLIVTENIAPEGYFVVCVRPWENSAQDLAQSVAASCDETARKTGLTPVILPVQPEMDMDISRQVAKAMQGPRVLIDRESTDVHLLYAFIAQSKFCVSMRLHPLICAFAAGRPALGLSYDQKVPAFLTDNQCGAWLDVKDLTREALSADMEALAAAAAAQDPAGTAHLAQMRKSISLVLDEAVNLIEA